MSGTPQTLCEPIRVIYGYAGLRRHGNLQLTLSDVSGALNTGKLSVIAGRDVCENIPGCSSSKVSRSPAFVGESGLGVGQYWEN